MEPGLGERLYTLSRPRISCHLGIAGVGTHQFYLVIYKLLSLNCFMLFALNGLYWFHKKLSIISSIDVKRLL